MDNLLCKEIDGHVASSIAVKPKLDVILIPSLRSNMVLDELEGVPMQIHQAPHRVGMRDVRRHARRDAWQLRQEVQIIHCSKQKRLRLHGRELLAPEKELRPEVQPLWWRVWVPARLIRILLRGFSRWTSQGGPHRMWRRHKPPMSPC